MKKIEFIAPVEAMRGNLSGTQDLLYAENDNKAYESPVGSRNYARNYQPRFIGAKRAANGLKYFQVRTKSAVGLTTKSKHQMALLGATGAIIGAILKDKTSTLYQSVVRIYESLTFDKPTSMRKWLSKDILTGLDAKKAVITIGVFPVPNYFTTFNNPFVSGGSSSNNVTISNEVLVKFWGELANAPIFFSVGGSQAVAHDEDDFTTIIDSSYNVLHLSEDESNKVKMGDQWLQKDNVYAESGDVLVDGSQYTLTSTEPA